MNPEDLAARANDLEDVVAIMDAIDDPKARFWSGLDLAGWRYELVPWGVRFFRRNDAAEVFVLVAGPHPSPQPGGVNPSAGLRVVVSTP